jgi:catechol 2,3-dioxygenase-like lactoylglutathione lyase family enzyme
MAYKRKKKKGIHHVCLRVPNLKQTADFYIYALGAELVCEWGKDGTDDHAYILDLGRGDFLEIFGTAENFDIGRWQHVAVWTDDIENSFKCALAYGASVVQKPAESHIPTRDGSIVNMSYGFVRAPGGEIIEFIQDIAPLHEVRENAKGDH